MKRRGALKQPAEFILAVLAGSICGSATAASDGLPSEPPALTGAWRLGQDGEGSRTCLVWLNGARVIGGYQLRAPRACGGAISRYDTFYAWFLGPKGTLVFADAARRSVLRFHKLPDGSWASERSDDERYLLRKVTPARSGSGKTGRPCSPPDSLALECYPLVGMTG